MTLITAAHMRGQGHHLCEQLTLVGLLELWLGREVRHGKGEWVASSMRRSQWAVVFCMLVSGER